ncbi:MAG: recombinase family protein [Fusicatenibacter sp.]|nr:recombinase family protein [Fusicatenibacter sp.]
MYQAGIYCRISREESEKEGTYSTSILSQIQMAKDFIDHHKDIAIAEIYADDGISGSHFDRPEFRRMLADIESGLISMVIFKDVSRLGREQIDTNYYLGKYFPEKRIRIVSLLDHYDSAAGTYDELLELKTLFNDLYLVDTSRKIKTAIRTKRSMGEYTPKEPPYGYVKSQKTRPHLEIDPPAARVVKRIYTMYLSGCGCTAISRSLNEEKIPSPAKYKKEFLNTGYAWNVGKGVWTPSAVRAILKNPVYTGAIVLRKTDKPSYKLPYRKEIPPEKQELIPNAHDAIISKEDFGQAQQIRRRNRV